MSSAQTIEALTATVQTLCKHVAALAAGMGDRMTQEDVADHFNVHRNTVRKWAKERKGFPTRDASGKYRRAEILEWETTRSTTPHTAKEHSA